MKKGNISIYISEIILFIYIIMFKPIIIDKFLKYIDIINIIFFSLLLLFMYITNGFPKKKTLLTKNAIEKIIIYSIIYYIVIYILGLFFGFLLNKHTLKRIIENIILTTIPIILKEIYRYIVIKKTNKKKYSPIIIVTILLSVLDIMMQINNYNFSNIITIFELIESNVIPNIALNILLSYCAYNFNYYITIVLQLFVQLPNYFIPIIPNMGNYFGSLIKIIFYYICYYKLSILQERYERKLSLKDRKKKNNLIIILIIPLCILIGLVSGIFKYHLFAIGSNSMIPIFSKGDAVLIEKTPQEEIKKLEVGDIIAYYHNNLMIVHRITKIETIEGKTIITTKGDNNPTEDAWTVNERDIYGKVITVIKYIGIPSIELNELITKERWIKWGKVELKTL